MTPDNPTRNPPAYWFLAKEHGLGWGMPARWQGWCVYLGALAALIGTFFVFPPAQAPLLFAASHVLVCVMVVLACVCKGEPAGRHLR